ncbi:alpha/beta hydrolase [Persicimonas caeni]|uniref:Alpha/beta hydrolase n=1 Tax=Persicimonas caeni TaxID=2292766 RepID=A0A4Y6PWQ9_PERCE|nr:alpha/beta hydrolase [Persicimonas caeni]QDG52569.1 alpha/beta hydrolase [Persicimonas caeni]QED33791.1 alpha/beta hydrolase [Persicimonas caeni]
MPDADASHTWRHYTWRALRLVVVAYVIYAGLLALLQRKMIFPGTDLPAGKPTGLAEAGGEQIWLQNEEGKVEAWFFPGKGVSVDKPGPAVIIAHGNGELIDGWEVGTAGRYRQAGVSVLLPEYRGYGRSDGTPTQKHITRDFVRFYDRLASRPEVDGERIVYHGFSLGGGVLASLARKRKPAAFILQSTFTRIADMARGVPVPEFLITDPFETLSVVESLDIPVLVVHGERDEVIPFEHGKRLAKAAKDADFLPHAGGHHLMTDQVAFWRAVRKLFVRAGIFAK